jgi:hypothetical protein
MRLAALTDRTSSRIAGEEFTVPLAVIARLGSDIATPTFHIPLVGGLIPFGAVNVSLFAVDIALIPVDIAFVCVLVPQSGMFITLYGVLIAHLNRIAVSGISVARHRVFGPIGHCVCPSAVVRCTPAAFIQPTLLLRVNSSIAAQSGRCSKQQVKHRLLRSSPCDFE